MTPQEHYEYIYASNVFCVVCWCILVFVYPLFLMLLRFILKKMKGNIEEENAVLSKRLKNINEKDDEYQESLKIKRLNDELSSIKNSIENTKAVLISDDEYEQYLKLKPRIDIIIDKCKSVSADVRQELREAQSELNSVSIELQKAKHACEKARAEADYARSRFYHS